MIRATLKIEGTIPNMQRMSEKLPVLYFSWNSRNRTLELHCLTERVLNQCRRVLGGKSSRPDTRVEVIETEVI